MNYLDTISEIDALIQKPCNKQRVESLVELLGSDADLNDYLFRTLERIDWLIPLVECGLIGAKNIPVPIQDGDGYRIPFWPPITYLLRVSEKTEVSDNEIINQLVKLVVDISKVKEDNGNLHYHLARVASNLPVSAISNEIIDCIPLWLRTRFDKMLVSRQICEGIIAKFIADFPNNKSIAKAEQALKYIIEIEIGSAQYEMIAEKEGTKIYQAVIDPYSLNELLLKKDLVKQLAEHTSNDLLIHLMDSMKLLLRRYVAGLGLRESDEEDTRIHITINGLNLILKLKENENYSSKAESIIKNFESLSRVQLGKQLLEFWKFHYPNSDLKKVQSQIETITYVLFDDSSPVWAPSIEKMNTRSDSNSGKHVFAYFIKLLFNEKLNLGGKTAKNVISVFTSPAYRLPLFRRILIHGIGEHWNEHKGVFWELVSNNDEYGYFTQHYYEEEIYGLLKSNAEKFNKKELQQINAIINKGYSEDYTLIDHGKDYNDYWELRWCSALKETSVFAERYKKLSEKLDRTTEDYEKDRTQVFYGPSSPLTKDEILSMDKADLANYMLDFKSDDQWRGPSVRGLVDAFKAAIIENPGQFTDHLDAFTNLPYDYMYSIVYGFEEAWKQNKQFDWKPVIDFCHSYVEQEGFGTDKLKSGERNPGADADWVIGAIGYLVTGGCRNKNHAFDSVLIPSVIRLLIKISPWIQPSKEKLKSSTDHVTYTYNSTAGKVLRAVVDCSLYKSQIENLPSENCWDSDLKDIFNSAFNRKVEDAYVMVGHYASQFLHLDKKWLLERVKRIYKAGRHLRKSFMAGILFERAPNEPTFFQLMIPHYKWVIKELQAEDQFGSALTRHLISFYFWETEKQGRIDLVQLFLAKASNEQIGNLMHHVWVNDKYLAHVEENKKSHFRDRILQLAKRIINQLDINEYDGSLRLITQLIHWVRFFDELNQPVFEFLLRVVVYSENQRDSGRLIEWLYQVKDKGEPRIIAERIGTILLKVELDQWLREKEKEQLGTLVRFIYDQQNKQLADDICNRYGKLRDFEFVREIYEEYNNSSNGKP